MRVAVIADVHANLAALEAVLARIEACGAERLVCLGDVVGYNADPAACVDLVRRRAHTVVAGNHDVDVARGTAAAGTHGQARQVQDWTRTRLDSADLDWLGGLPGLALDPAGLLAAHGCYLNTLFYTGYVTGTMLETNLRAVAARPEWPQVALCGHTHVPMCGWLGAEGAVEARFDGAVDWPAGTTVLVNPGSVGQPRDGDPRAAFALIDPQARRAELLRVPYDIERAVRALHQAGLPEALGERLREGR
jgi:predicted phosphodiesterase